MTGVLWEKGEERGKWNKWLADLVVYTRACAEISIGFGRPMKDIEPQSIQTLTVVCISFVFFSPFLAQSQFCPLSIWFPGIAHTC
jgi:hypothetical protein